MHPLILTKPIVSLLMLLYLCITQQVVNIDLVQEIEKQKGRVYFVSRTLQGSNVKYQKIEEGHLTKVITTRELRYYFQTFKIVVKTDFPIRQVLQKKIFGWEDNEMSCRIVGIQHKL